MKWFLLFALLLNVLVLSCCAPRPCAFDILNESDKFTKTVHNLEETVMKLEKMLGDSTRTIDDNFFPYWTFIIYSDNRGGNEIHRQCLFNSSMYAPDLYLNLGDTFYYGKDYGSADSMRADFDKIYTYQPDEYWNAIYPTPGGHDERYYDEGKEGNNEAGQKLLDEFGIFAPNKVIERDEWGDYYFRHKDIYFISLYRSDVWAIEDEQAAWIDTILGTIRYEAPDAPIIMMSHDMDWFNPEISDGEQMFKDWDTGEYIHSYYNGIENDSLRLRDQVNRLSIYKSCLEHNVDVLLAADAHDYYCKTYKNMLKIRDGAAGYGHNLFMVFEVGENAFRITAYKPDGTLFDILDYKDWYYEDILPVNFPARWFKPFGGKAIPLIR